MTRWRIVDPEQAREDRRGRKALERRGTRVCRACGCTDHNPCEHEHLGACSWIEHDRCSRCEAWIHAYIGRDFLRGRGWTFSAELLPAAELMRPGEEGLWCLAALSIEIRTTDRWPFLAGSVRSDAGEIATRRAGLMGWPPLWPPQGRLVITIHGLDKLRDAFARLAPAIEAAGQAVRDAVKRMEAGR